MTTHKHSHSIYLFTQRTAIRVLHTLALSTDIYETDRFASDYDAMYAFIQGAADWTQLLPHSSCTFSILVRESPGDTRRSGPPQERRHGRGRVAGPPAVQIFGSQRAQLCAKNAICDALRDAGLDKPARPVNHAGAYLPLLLSIHGGQVTLYRDMAGASLHKRGYRSDSALHRSSLNEAVASGMLLLAGFGVDGSFRAQQKGNPGLSGGASAGLEQASGGGPPKKSLVVCDPMCGSGTLLIEAALIRLHVAPGLYRESFPFQDWSDFDQGAWDELVDAAVSSQRRDEDINMELIGNDAEPAALALAERDLRRTNLSHAVRLVHGSAAELQLDKQVTLVVSNPPWGRRLEGEDEAWYALGSFLRNNARAGSAMLLSGDPALTRGIRMRAREKYPIRVGDVDCRALAYDVLPAKKS